MGSAVGSSTLATTAVVGWMVVELDVLTAAVGSGMVGGAAVDDCVGACLLVGLSFVGEGWEGAAGAGIYIQTVLVGGVSTGT